MEPPFKPPVGFVETGVQLRRSTQPLLFAEPEPVGSGDAQSSTFTPNMQLPVHRWFRYSAGFSAVWVQEVVRSLGATALTVLDPFAGSGTTVIAAQTAGVEATGIESHPFVRRIAQAKLAYRSEPDTFLKRARKVSSRARQLPNGRLQYPPLIMKCYDQETLHALDALRRAYEEERDDSSSSELVWLALVASLRRASNVNTAQWQYVLPNKAKKRNVDAFTAYDESVAMIYDDMRLASNGTAIGSVVASDARTCEGLPEAHYNLVITSPPYPNNYDYADATRLEMSFMGEVSGWGDLQTAVRQHLIRSCSQHVPEKSVDLEAVLASPELGPIVGELKRVCHDLATIRESKGGRKTYHLMVACYFKDLAQTWQALSRVCSPSARACFVIGDSAPYGIYVPVVPWLGTLATASGFRTWRFEKTRDRNTKWKNRKHRVPLQEGRLWVER